MNTHTWQKIAAVFGFLAVALGAFGAHGLKEILDSNGSREWWQTAALYHVIHSLALLYASRLDRFQKLVGWAFAIGICLFSGSLYLMAITQMTRLGMITPLGGLAFLIGWLGIFLAKPGQPQTHQPTTATTK